MGLENPLLPFRLLLPKNLPVIGPPDLPLASFAKQKSFIYLIAPLKSGFRPFLSFSARIAHHYTLYPFKFF